MARRGGLRGCAVHHRHRRAGFDGYLIGMAISGLGFGMYMAVDLALVVDVLPDSGSAAKDLGVLNIAGALPFALAPALAPAILGMTDESYPALFAVAGGCALLGAAAILRDACAFVGGAEATCVLPSRPGKRPYPPWRSLHLRAKQVDDGRPPAVARANTGVVRARWLHLRGGEAALQKRVLVELGVDPRPGVAEPGLAEGEEGEKSGGHEGVDHVGDDGSLGVADERAEGEPDKEQQRVPQSEAADVGEALVPYGGDAGDGRPGEVSDRPDGEGDGRGR